MREAQTAQEIDLSEGFLKLGAFATDYFSKDIIMGLGGESYFSKSIPSDDCFYLKDFYEDNYLIYRPKDFITLSCEEFKKTLLLQKEIQFSPLQNEDEVYKKDFQLLKNDLNDSLKKVVLISREDYSLPKDQLKARIHLLKKCLSFPSGNAYGFWTEDYGILGNTPEFLYAILADQLFTHAIAGSARLEEKEFLLNSQKDRIEHDFVIRDITEKLRNLSSKITIHETETLPYKSMIHLMTPIQVNLQKSWSHESLLSSLSPTAALGGYPTEEAKTFLKRTQYFKNYKQRFFGSAFGLKTSKINQAMVAIRNIQWNQEKLWIESGGGVVKDSIEEKELQEIQMKREVIRDHYLC